MWQEPDLADVDVPGVSIIGGHDDVLRVLGGEAGDQARVEEAHLAAPEDTDPGSHGQLGHRGGPETKTCFSHMSSSIVLMFVQRWRCTRLFIITFLNVFILKHYLSNIFCLSVIILSIRSCNIRKFTHGSFYQSGSILLKLIKMIPQNTLHDVHTRTDTRLL